MRYAMAVGGSILACGIGVVLARRRLVVVRIRGMSMAPTFHPGDRVLVRRILGGRLRRGQVVVLETPLAKGDWRTTSLPEPDGAPWLLKRVVAVPGDPV